MLSFGIYGSLDLPCPKTEAGVRKTPIRAVKASYFSGLAVPPQLGGCFGRLNFCRPGAESN
ncbi:MAG: hypothetical protein CMM59_11675 [Rhodospirillaceae bacterium]|nr:hypothetical protein [Rhodospirillaceae bacterium]